MYMYIWVILLTKITKRSIRVLGVITSLGKVKKGFIKAKGVKRRTLVITIT